MKNEAGVMGCTFDFKIDLFKSFYFALRNMLHVPKVQVGTFM